MEALQAVPRFDDILTYLYTEHTRVYRTPRPTFPTHVGVNRGTHRLRSR